MKAQNQFALFVEKRARGWAGETKGGGGGGGGRVKLGRTNGTVCEKEGKGEME